MGGRPFLVTTTIAYNGLSVATENSLADTGAGGEAFVSLSFAKKLKKELQIKPITGFCPQKIDGYDGKSVQVIDVAFNATLHVQGREIANTTLLVIDMKHHDLILGRKWLEKHDIMLDVSRRRLLFPPSTAAAPTTIPLDDLARTEQREDCQSSTGEQRRLEAEFRRQADLLEDRKTQLPEEVLTKEEDPEACPALSGNSSPSVSDSDDDEDILRDVLDLRPASGSRKGRPELVSSTELKRLSVKDRISQLKRLQAEQRAEAAKPNISISLIDDGLWYADGTSFKEPPPDFLAAPSDHLDSDLRKMIRQITEDEREPDTISEESEKSEEEEHRPNVQFDMQGPYILTRGDIGWHKRRPLDVALVGSVAFLDVARHTSISTITLAEVDHLLESKKQSAEPMPEDTEDLRRALKEVVPEEYHHQLLNWSKAESDKLPAFRAGVDHHIHLNPGSDADQLGYSPLYKMSVEELEVCRAYIQENLEKGFIVPSSAPWSAPVLMAAKPGGGLRFCVDYRKLNALTKKDRYPLPLIKETLANLSKAKYFTKLDIRQAFHRIRIAEGDSELTAFRCRYGAYEYKVMPFGLSNGPATFQRYINGVLQDYLDVFCSAYIDDILIYSDTLEEHRDHVNKVLDRLRAAGLQADLKKSEFHVQETKYLGFVVGTQGIQMDPTKLEAVRNWKAPQTITQVQSFLGLCNFYRDFVPAYSRIVKPLTTLTRKEVNWRWGEGEVAAFLELKERLLMAPILAHYDYDKPTVLETDASNGVVAGVLTQYHEDDKTWHPVGYYSESMQGAELNYAIHDKELMAVVKSMKFWRAELIGLQRPEFKVITDHRALEYFGTKRLLNVRQAGYAETLSQFNFTITYRPGSENVVADALSRHDHDLRTLKQRQEDERSMAIFRYDGRVQQVDPLTSLHAELATIGLIAEAGTPPPLSGVMLADKLLKDNESDPDLEIYRAKARSEEEGPWTLLQDRYVLYQGRLVVPAKDFLRTRVIEDLHSRIVTAHPGKLKTRQLVASKFWWPGLAKDVEDFVNNCPCRPSKDPRDKTPGLLHPIPVPNRPWQHIVMDFKSQPPCKHGDDNALVMVDKLSKESHTIPCKKTATARDAALMYFYGPFREHGLPAIIGTDRGPQFIADFTDEMSRILGIEWRLSSSGHSQSAGQAEVMNAYLDQRLRPWVNHQQDDWCEGLPAMDAAQRACPHESLGGLTPFEVTHGFPMPLHFNWENRTTDFATARERLNREDAQDLMKTFKGYFDAARRGNERAQDRMATQVNKHRREPDFDVGDYVYIIKKFWSTDRPSDKLDYPLTRCSYRIIARKGHSFEVEVPSTWRMRNVFPPDRLRKDPRTSLPGQDLTRPQGEEIDGELEWVVDHIVSSRLYYGKLQYRAQWEGWDPDPDFYDASSYKNACEKLRQFHELHPDSEGPPARLSAWKAAKLAGSVDAPHKNDNVPVAKKGLIPLRRSNRKK